MDEISVTTSENIFTRLGKGLVATLMGLAMVPGSIYLLYWNEGRAVDAIRALDEGVSQLVEANPATVDAALNGRLVHVSGTAETGQPARDSTFGVSAPTLLRVSRKVEMYQWDESKSSTTQTSTGGTKTTTTTYSYNRKWSDSHIDSDSFKNASAHENPKMPFDSSIADSSDVKLGAFHLDTAVLDHAENFQPLPPPAQSTVAGFHKDGDYLYRGTSTSAPEIGDVRVSFAGIAAQPFSVVAKDASGTLTPFVASNGYVIALLAPGVVSGAQLFNERKEHEGNLTWILRGVGFVLMLIGFAMMLNLLSTLASVLPFLGTLVEGGVLVLAFSAAVPITLLTIAIAWLTHRPLVAVPMIIAAIGFFVMMLRRRRGAKSAVARMA